jgi:hypothetical protein
MLNNNPTLFILLIIMKSILKDKKKVDEARSTESRFIYFMLQK